MPAGKRKVGHFKYLSDAVKKPMIRRRRAGLFKKAEELSVLCGVKIGIVMNSPTEIVPIVWPERELTENLFRKFVGLEETEKLKKMVTHEGYLRDRVGDEMEKMKKKEDEVERKEMNMLMNEVIMGKSLTEMDARQLKGLYELAGEKMKELEKRKQDLQNGGGAAAEGNGTSSPPSSSS